MDVPLVRHEFVLDMRRINYLCKELKQLKGYSEKVVIFKFSDGFYATRRHFLVLKEKVKVDFSKLSLKMYKANEAQQYLDMDKFESMVDKTY